MRSVSPEAARRRRCAARARRALGEILAHTRLAQAGDGGVECVLRAADEQVAEADGVEAQALAKIALGNTELIAAALKRLRRVATGGEDQVVVMVALKGVELGVIGVELALNLLRFSEQQGSAAEIADGDEGGCKVRAAALPLCFVAALIGVGDGLPGYVHSLAGADEHQQRGSEFPAVSGFEEARCFDGCRYDPERF